jgi:uncharacterized membrane protein HdeD (DUF308 family)/predicted esterase
LHAGTAHWRRWLVGLAGLAAAAVGALLFLDPFASLTVLIGAVVVGLVLLAVDELAAAGRRWTAWLTGAAWLAAAVLVLTWPRVTIRVLALVVGIAAVAVGVRRLAAGVRGTDEQRVVAVLLGAATVGAGGLLLAWPDVTVFVVAAGFGATLVVQGLTHAWNALRPPGEARPRTRARRLARTAGAVAALVVVGVLLAVSIGMQRASPRPDAFYTAPAGLPDEPGHLLRSEPFTRGMPEGTHAWRILYTTTREDGVPAVASGLVLVGGDAPGGPRPVVAWAHGTTGFAERCAPTLLRDPLAAGAMPALDQVVANGWVLVATDYTGLGTTGPHLYLIGQGEGRSVLDSVRAARELDGVELSDETVVWGHSQGGHAALWTGMLAPAYAPDVPLHGVAALAPASDLPELVTTLDNLSIGSLFAAYAVAAYDAIYPDVRFDDVVRPGAGVQVREMAGRCLSEPKALVSVLDALSFGRTVLARGSLPATFAERLAENVPTGPIDAPVLVAQGGTDPLVLPAMQQEFVALRCADGQAVDYRVYEGRDHMGVVADDSPLVPDLLAWTQDRFDGLPAASTCP